MDIMPLYLSKYFAVVTSIVLILLVQLIIKRRSRSLPLPPGPKPLPLIGNLHQVPESHRWLHFYRWSRDAFGPVMYLNVGGIPMVFLSTHEAAKDLLIRRGAHYSDRPRFVILGEMVTKGMHQLIRPYDAKYRLHRRLEAPILGIQAAERYRPVQELESRQLLFDLMKSCDEKGDAGVEYHHFFSRTVASIIYFLLYGYRFKTGRERELQDAHTVQEAAIQTAQLGKYLVDVFPSLNILPRILAPWKAEAEALYVLERNLHLGNFRRALESPGWNVTKQMKENSDNLNATETVVSEEEIAFDLGVLADAALDTTSIALQWFIVAWVTHGSGFVLQAQRTLDEVVGKDRLPQFEDRPQLVFIEAICNEVLRWRPVTPGGMPHLTKQEDTYNGYRIPAGSMVVGNHFAIARDESVYGVNADLFLPGRWLADTDDEDSKGTPTLMKLPQVAFGFGRRMCTGRHIALNSLFIVIARLLWAFDLQLAPAENKSKVNNMGGRWSSNNMDVEDTECIDGFSFGPKPFKVIFRPRGPWARKLIMDTGDTHEQVDLEKVLRGTQVDDEISKAQKL